MLPAAGRAAVLLCAALFLLQVGTAVFGLPFGLGSWIVAADWVGEAPPKYVVVLGGGGIPSESGLMRTFYAAYYGTNFADSVYVVCLPADGDPDAGSVGAMREELVRRGVRRDAIQMEYRGRNTHEQAVGVRELLGKEALGEPVLLVSSPTHMRRALLCFSREGFTDLQAAPARAVGAEADLGPGVGMRYRFWQNLETNIRVVRELVALAYYRLRGWI
jgi:uncharacterized SAM-binding protein YcdF (DUF218 family)